MQAWQTTKVIRLSNLLLTPFHRDIFETYRRWTCKAQQPCKGKFSDVTWQTTNVTRWSMRTGISMSQRKCEAHKQQSSWLRLRPHLGVNYSAFGRLEGEYRPKPFNAQHLVHLKTEDYFKRLFSNEINCLREHFELKDYGSHRMEESVLQSN